jgi:hypothetical protein
MDLYQNIRNDDLSMRLQKKVVIGLRTKGVIPIGYLIAGYS